MSWYELNSYNLIKTSVLREGNDAKAFLTNVQGSNSTNSPLHKHKIDA